MAGEPLISFRILGPIEIAVAGRPIRLPAGHPRALLTLLLIRPNRVLPPDELIDALWGDQPPRTATNVLQAHIATVRRALRAGGSELVGRLETHPSGYRFRVEPNELDAAIFESEVAEAGRLASADPTRAAARLRTAIALWRGSAAGGVGHASITGAATRFEELRLAACESLAELDLRLGRAREIIPDLEELAREQPFRERLHALLMIALYRSGRQADALAAYRAARQTLVDELGVEPGPELRALELAVLRQDPGLRGTASVPGAMVDSGPAAGLQDAGMPAFHHRPSTETTFIGRTEELATVVELLGEQRLVTITGTGGIGKTRFAVQVAALALDQFPGGAWFVDLTPVPDEERLRLAVAAGFAVSEVAGRDIIETIVERVGDERRLLIIDNCEHVIEPCARVTEVLHRDAPGLSILATSREPLRLASEVLWRLAPLKASEPLQPRTTDSRMPDAVRLFLNRANRVRPGRNWTSAEIEVIAEICRRLEGLPLAIEMAAARLRVLEPQDVLDRLDDRFRLLTDGARTAIPRHRTLRATLDWSFELLEETDRAVLRRMSAFATAVSPAAVEAVCGGGGVDAVEAAVRLVDRSLAVSAVELDGRSRFGLLDTVREYGRVQLRAAGEDESAARRHLAYWTSFADEAFGRRHEDRDTQADALEREVGELRLALDRAHTLGGGAELALAARLGWFWAHHTHLTEGRRLLDRALASSEGDELDRALCLCATGALAALQGEASHAYESLDAGLAVLHRRGERVEECAALDDLGWARFFLGDVDGALAVFERAVEVADRTGVLGLVRRTNAGLCQLLVAKGEVERASSLAEDLLRIAGGDLWTAHLGHHFRADCALIAGDPVAAVVEYRIALELARQMGNTVETAGELEGVALALAGSGEPELAIRLKGAAEATFAAVGAVIDIAFWNQLTERYLGPARELLGARVADIDRAGRGLTLDEAIREALAAGATPARAA